MMETMNISPESDEHDAAVFGSRYTVRGTVHQAQAIIGRHLENNEAEYLLLIEYEIAPEDLPRPPREIRSITRLADVSEDVLGELEIDCNATFVYDTQDGFHSRVSLPAPLLLTQQDNPGSMTHMESVRLSRRIENQIIHSVEIIPSEDGSSVTHIVNYGIKSELTETMMRHMLELAGSISLNLVYS